MRSPSRVHKPSGSPGKLSFFSGIKENVVPAVLPEPQQPARSLRSRFQAGDPNLPQKNAAPPRFPLPSPGPGDLPTAPALAVVACVEGPALGGPTVSHSCCCSWLMLMMLPCLHECVLTI